MDKLIDRIRKIRQWIQRLGIFTDPLQYLLNFLLFLIGEFSLGRAFCHRSDEFAYALSMFPVFDKLGNELGLSLVFFRKPFLLFAPLALFLAAALPLFLFEAIFLDRSRCNLDPDDEASKTIFEHLNFSIRPCRP